MEAGLCSLAVLFTGGRAEKDVGMKEATGAFELKMAADCTEWAARVAMGGGCSGSGGARGSEAARVAAAAAWTAAQSTQDEERRRSALAAAWAAWTAAEGAEAHEAAERAVAAEEEEARAEDCPAWAEAMASLKAETARVAEKTYCVAIAAACTAAQSSAARAAANKIRLAEKGEMANTCKADAETRLPESTPLLLNLPEPVHADSEHPEMTLETYPSVPIECKPYESAYTLEPSIDSDKVKAAAPAKLFLCYAREDRPWLDELLLMLAPELHCKALELWYDKKIEPSQDWRREIENALLSARAGILLVSMHFLASDFIMEVELPFLISEAEKANVKLSWVLVGHAMYEGKPFTKFNALHDINKPLSSLRGHTRHKVLKDIARGIVKMTS